MFGTYYYDAFMTETVVKCPDSQFISDGYQTPIRALPIWASDGLFLRIERMRGQEMEWLIKSIKKDLARFYTGCKMTVKPKMGLIYIHLHETPVEDFIQSSTRSKFDYALAIREQHLELMRHVEEIFQDYIPEAE